jgi:hypothetical protein
VPNVRPARLRHKSSTNLPLRTQDQQSRHERSIALSAAAGTSRERITVPSQVPGWPIGTPLA